jgi:polysaccharide pyruvyl transferase WcaK-like protein
MFGIIGDDNLGNDASLNIVVRRLRRSFPTAGWGFMGMGPDKLERQYGAPASHLQWFDAHEAQMPPPAKLWKALGRCFDIVRVWRWVRGHDVVIVPGAGVLESTTPTRPWARHMSLFVLAISARLTRTPLALVGVGASPAHGAISRWEVTTAVRLATYRAFRDEISRDAMRGMGARVDDIPVHGDVFFTETAPSRRPSEQPTVGIGVMNYVGSQADLHRADELHAVYVDAVRALTSQLVGEGWHVRLFIGDPEDQEVLEAVMAAVRDEQPERAGALRQCAADSLVDLMEGLADVHLVVASRYHNVLCALRLGIPTLSISYGAKSDVVMQSMGLSEFCQAADGIDAGRLVAQFHDLAERREELMPGIAAGLACQEEAANDQLTELVTFVEDVTGLASAPDVAMNVQDHA